MFKNRILSAYGSSLLGIFSGLVTNLWLLREIARRVSVADLGLYAFVLQISSYLSILQLGLDFASSRQIAEFLGKNDPAAASRTYYELRRVNARMAVAVGVIVLGVALVFARGVGIPQGTSPALAGKIALFAGGAQVINFLTLPRMAALIGGQQMSAVNLLIAGRTILTSLLAYPLLTGGLGVLCAPVSETICQALAFGSLVRLCRTRCAGWLSPPGQERDHALLRSVFSFGSLAALGGLGWTVEATSDVLILGWLAGPALVAVYVLWWRFPQMAFDLCSRLAASAFPQFAQRHGQSAEAARVLLAKVSVLTVGLASLALLGIGLWLPDFIRVWVGDAFAAGHPRVLAGGMGLLVCLRTCGNLLGLFWLAKGTPRLTTVLSWVQAAVKIGAALALTPRYGLVGLVAASCLSTLLQTVVLCVYLLGEKLLDAPQVRRLGAMVGVACLVVIAAWGVPGERGIVALFLGALLTVAAWSVVWLAFAWDTELHPALLAMTGRLGRRLGLAPRLARDQPTR